MTFYCKISPAPEQTLTLSGPGCEPVVLRDFYRVEILTPGCAGRSNASFVLGIEEARSEARACRDAWANRGIPVEIIDDTGGLL